MSGMGAMTGDGGAAWSQQAAAAGPVSGDGDGPPNVDAAFKLQVEEGATVSATFPFFGDIAGGQLSFQIGDHITVRPALKIWVTFSSSGVQTQRQDFRAGFLHKIHISYGLSSHLERRC